MSTTVHVHRQGRWFLVPDALLSGRHRSGEERWQRVRERIRQQPPPLPTLRDVAQLISAVPVAAAYNHAAALYRRIVIAQLGAQPSAARLAGAPLHPLFHAPPLPDGDYPLLAAARDAPDHLYLRSSWQKRPAGPRRLLCCFTSRTHTLSMPLVTFHAFALTDFDAIAYFYDPDRDFYRHRQADLAAAITSLLDWLAPDRLAFVGTSAGASLAIKHTLAHPGARGIAGSPVLQEEPLLADHLARTAAAEALDAIRITWGRNRADLCSGPLFEALGEPHRDPPIAYDLSAVSTSHGSLGIAALTGLLPRLLHWAADPQCSAP